jgi:5-methyltetrahydrofolate--homocysteine methyltransferase
VRSIENENLLLREEELSMDWFEKLSEAVVKGRKKEIAAMAEEAVRSGVPAIRLVNEGITPGMNAVSELWKKGEYFVPEVMRSAATMQTGMDALKQYLVSGEHGNGVKVAIGTVKGDLHDIGKNLVAIMLEGVGYEIQNLGVNVEPQGFIDAARKGAKVIGLSSLLTTSMPEMKNVVEAFKASGLRDQVVLIIGGAPITAEFARSIGADHFAKDAADAVEILNRRFAGAVAKH